MRRLSLAGTGLLLLLGACTSAPVTSTPLQVADEHPSFASCATYVQASLPGPDAAPARAGALEQCLARNPASNQVAMRPSA